MSEEEPTMATPSIMEAMMAMFNNLNNTITEINTTMINNNESLRAEMFELIDQRSRKSTRVPTRTTSRAVSPKTLVAQVSAKLESRNTCTRNTSHQWFWTRSIFNTSLS